VKLKTEKLFHASLVLKGFYHLLELSAGTILLFVSSSSQIYNFIHNLFEQELLEDPHDFVANFIVNLFGNIQPSLKLFFGTYLFVAGIINLGLIIALWKEKLIAYPISIIFFSLFVIYQIYRYILTPSWILIILTILDLIIIFLSYREYKTLKNKS
jgi:uncharacterized membrane protein